MEQTLISEIQEFIQGLEGRHEAVNILMAVTSISGILCGTAAQYAEGGQEELLALSKALLENGFWTGLTINSN